MIYNLLFLLTLLYPYSLSSPSPFLSSENVHIIQWFTPKNFLGGNVIFQPEMAPPKWRGRTPFRSKSSINEGFSAKFSSFRYTFLGPRISGGWRPPPPNRLVWEVRDPCVTGTFLATQNNHCNSRGCGNHPWFVRISPKSVVFWMPMISVLQKQSVWPIEGTSLNISAGNALKQHSISLPKRYTLPSFSFIFGHFRFIFGPKWSKPPPS